jgi:hypothetical protein
LQLIWSDSNLSYAVNASNLPQEAVIAIARSVR